MFIMFKDYSLLSVSQMCRKGYEVLFSSTSCVITKEKTCKKIAEGVRTCGNVYYIKDKREIKCFLVPTETGVEIVPAIIEKTSDPQENKEKKTNEEEEEEEGSKKVYVECVQKHHSKNQIIGDKTKGVQTRREIVEAREQANYYFLSITELNTYEEASKDESWVKVMEEELNQIQKNKTWELVPRLVDKNVIGTKWVFRNKINEQGQVTRNKLRLVCKGYS